MPPASKPAAPAKERPWPAAAITMRPISELTAYARNPNTHSPEQVDQIAASITEFGFTIPVLVDEECVILAGHGRIMAAQKLGLRDVPVMVARGWTDAQKRAYVIADNQIPRNSEFDLDLLKLEIGDLKAVDFNLDLLGFSDLQVVEFVSGFGDGRERPEAPIDANKTLAERFGVPPFSVLNAREGWWQDRKRAWIALGIQSELGRGAPIGGGASTDGPREGSGGGSHGKSPGDNGARPQSLPRSKAAPGGSMMPAADYSQRKRGDGRGRPVG